MSEERVVNQTIQPLTRTLLKEKLHTLGIRAGMTVIVHSSMSRLGWICGGPVAVIQGLQDVLTPSGTLVMPTHTANLSDPKEWGNPAVPEGWWKEIRKEMPAFDPQVTPTYFMGHIAETFRTMPGVCRSNHPRYSFAAWGNHAEEVVRNHSLDYGMGEDSPLGRIHERDGYVLLLGVGYENNTSMHLGEHRSGCYSTLTKESPILENGTRVWKSFADLDYDDEQFPSIGKTFAKYYPVSEAKTGNGIGTLMKQADIVEHTATSIQKMYKK